MITKICEQPESNLSFKCGNSVAEETNLKPVKAVHRNERVLSLAQNDEHCYELI